jgi:hypothetical protein
MSWRVARSLEQLRSELNQAAPHRSKSADGGIGDEEHATRASDHNPWAPLPGGGVVTARDFTHDPKGGLDCEVLGMFLRAKAKAGDRRVKYVIWDRRIASVRDDWAWRPYHGTSPHTHHLHLSVAPAQRLFDDDTPWRWGKSAPEPAKTNTPSTAGQGWGAYYLGRPGARTVRLFSAGADVKVLQAFIGTASDGYFGAKTQAAVKNYQRMRGLQVDGVVGPRTWAPIVGALRL